MTDSKRGPLDDDLEREIAEALGDASIEDMMYGDAPHQKGARRGKSSHDDDETRTRSGTIIAVHRGDVIVEFNAKEQGLCPGDQFKHLPPIGSREEFIVQGVIPGESLYQLSRPGGVAAASWDMLQVGMTVEAVVSGKNSGGLELTLAAHKAFMPVSQIELGRVEDLEPYVNQKLRCDVMELDRGKKRIILSRRAVLEREREENKAKAFEELKIGEERDGTVRRIEKFGAFVEILPGVDGLLHIGDMSWSRINDPKQMVQIGQVLHVRILAMDAEQGRISLGLKQVAGDPWEAVAMKFPAGSVHTGTVTRAEVYGAFVELEPGIEGLIHVSQLSTARVRRVTDAVKIGQSVSVTVMETDTIKRRIGLSMIAGSQSQNDAEQATTSDQRQYIKKESETRSMQSLMDKFGSDSGLKGGIG